MDSRKTSYFKDRQDLKMSKRFSKNKRTISIVWVEYLFEEEPRVVG